MDFSEILLPKREVYEFGSDCSDCAIEDGLKREKTRMAASEKIAALRQIHNGYTDLRSTWEDEPTGTSDNVGMRRTQTDIGLAPWVTRG